MVRYTPDEIKAKFPHPTLQRVEGEPDYAAINAIMQPQSHQALGEERMDI